VFTKKTTIGNCQGMLNVSHHALKVANFEIVHPALLEINRKIAVMEGDNSHLVKKLASLYLSSVCFLG
jgi:hypothetical protein